MSKDEPKSAEQVAVQLAEETLTGDLRDALLTHVRSMQTPWSKMSERDQGDKIDAIEKLAEDTVRRAVSIIARRGFDVIPVIVKDFGVKGRAIKGKFEALTSEATLVALGDHQEQAAIIVLTDASDFVGEQAQARPDKDQPDLLSDEEDDDDEPDETDDDDMVSIGSVLPESPEPPAATA